MDIEAFELEITNRLKTVLTETHADINQVAESEAEFNMPVSKNKIEVFFHEEQFKDTQAVDIIIQPKDVFFGVILYSRKLRGEWGVYDMIKRIKKTLIGYKPTDCTNKISAVKFEFSKREENLWVWVFTGKTKAVEVEDTEEVLGPVLTTVNSI